MTNCLIRTISFEGSGFSSIFGLSGLRSAVSADQSLLQTPQLLVKTVLGEVDRRFRGGGGRHDPNHVAGRRGGQLQPKPFRRRSGGCAPRSLRRRCRPTGARKPWRHGPISRRLAHEIRSSRVVFLAWTRTSIRPSCLALGSDPQSLTLNCSQRLRQSAGHAGHPKTD